MTTALFIVSLFVLCGLVGFKVFEIKFRKTHFLSGLFGKGDEKIHQYINILNSQYYRYKEIAHIFVFDFIPSYTYELLVRMKDYVSKKYYSAGDEFRGRRILRTNGSVSFFLERLAEDRPKTSEPKI